MISPAPVRIANKRPLSVTLISWLVIAAAAMGLAKHLTEFKVQHPFDYDIVWVSIVRLTAIVCGVFMLRARNWARWLLVIWITYHVVLSAFHTATELIIHGVLLG